ncbi:hypothetical protein CHUAL_008444 [Chamberlinius hualienensis]
MGMIVKFQWKLITLWLLWTIATVKAQNKFADKVRDCYMKDKTRFNDCLINFWQEIKPILKNGIPELNIPKLDPMSISNIEFSEGGSVVQGKAIFSNVMVVGIGDYVPKFVTVDTKSRVVKVALRVPVMYITGNYSIDGVVFLLPVKGNGAFSMNLTGVDGIATAHLQVKGSGVRASKIDVDFTIEKIHVKLIGLLGGDSVGEAVNNMLNDNSQQILEDVKPMLSQKLSEVITTVLADVFVDMPSDAFFT